MKALITITIVLLSAITLADFKPETHNWNEKTEQLLIKGIPDLISLFTKEDVYVYQDIDIFGYTSNPVTDKLVPISISD